MAGTRLAGPRDFQDACQWDRYATCGWAGTARDMVDMTYLDVRHWALGGPLIGGPARGCRVAGSD